MEAGLLMEPLVNPLERTLTGSYPRRTSSHTSRTFWRISANRPGCSCSDVETRHWVKWWVLSLRLAVYKEASSWSQMYDAGYKNIVNLDVSHPPLRWPYRSFKVHQRLQMDMLDDSADSRRG